MFPAVTLHSNIRPQIANILIRIFNECIHTVLLCWYSFSRVAFAMHVTHFTVKYIYIYIYMYIYEYINNKCGSIQAWLADRIRHASYTLAKHYTHRPSHTHTLTHTHTHTHTQKIQPRQPYHHISPLPLLGGMRC